MIVLPDGVHPRRVSPQLVEAGLLQRGFAGQITDWIDRPGSHWLAEVELPPMPADDARVIESRLLRARGEGMRIDWPLRQISQGSPGAPVVDGAGQAGTTLALRGLTAHWTAKEGYWLTIVSAAGQHYLHNVAATLQADAAGELALPIWPALRAPFADGDAVLLARPKIEGKRVSEISWEWTPGHLASLSFTIEEQA